MDEVYGAVMWFAIWGFVFACFLNAIEALGW